MIVNVYDVGHGFCGYVRDELTGANILIDCGYNERTGVHPAESVVAQYGPIGGLVIQNYDEDHVDGLPRLLARGGPQPASVLYGNPSITPREILSLKTPPYGDGILALMRLKARYTRPIAGGGLPGECYISQYWNPYPSFDNTNDLSLVTFVHGPGYSVIFAGDLEGPGWRALLWNAAFRRELALVRVFVASHHGRDSGYCAEVFEHCRPEVVIISDGEIQYDTQVHCYAQRASGIPWNGGRETRRVLTTRRDGDIRISPGLGYAGVITTSAA
jgi:beta-lactamase superfamily II metal-dependent hydrolase